MMIDLEKYYIKDKNTNYAVIKGDNAYKLFDNDTKSLICSMSYYIYDDIKNFDWINLADIITEPEYRGQGYASKLLPILISDLNKRYPDMGLYLLVAEDNLPAIKLYTNNGFKTLRIYRLKKTKYIDMYRGEADTSQLMNTKFRG